MSIIYDALKKTQANRLKEETIVISDKKNRFGIWTYIGVILFILSLIIIKVTDHSKSNKHSGRPIKSNTSLLFSKSTPIALQLNGVILSGTNSSAMINNKMYSIGDSVDDMKLIAISLNKVTLQKSDSSIFELSQV